MPEEPTWTPGPWRFVNHVAPVTISGQKIQCLEVEADTDPLWIAKVQFHGPNIRSTKGTANAQLIAAAPELYDALKEQREWTTSGPCQLPMINPCRCADCKNRRADAALAKARGEQYVSLADPINGLKTPPTRVPE
jgi:hypothetical protein